MAGRRPQKPKATVFVQMPKPADAKTRRTVEPLYQAILELQARGTADPVVVAGSRASGAALESLLAALVALGVITDKTEA